MKKYKIIATVCIASVFCSCQTSNVSNKQDNLNDISEPVIEIKNLKEIEYAESLTNIFIKSVSSPKEIIKGRKAIVLFNKSDLVTKVTREDIAIDDNIPVINISAKNQTGITEFEESIKDMFFNGELEFNDEVFITNARQKNDISQAYESMKLVLNSVEAGMPEDFYTIDLMNAYELLGRVVGEAIEDDLVDKIFSKFCMGK